MSSSADDEGRGALSGPEYVRRLASGELPPSPTGRLMGFRLVEVEEGRAVFAVEPGARHSNGVGIAHGGLAATLIDSATGCAVNALMPAGRVFATLEMKVDCVRPPTPRAGEARCEARVTHAGDRTATAEARVTDAAGQLYAHGAATCMLFRG